MRRFFAPKDCFDGKVVRLAEEETHHLRDVLRLGPGDLVHVYDGEGAEFTARVTSVDKRSAHVEIIGPVDPTSPESPLDLTLAAVQKAAELGVAALVPLYSGRCEVRRGDPASRMTRWRRIAQASIRQSGRAQNMHIGEPVQVTTFLEGVNASSTILFSERSGRKLPSQYPGKKMTALVGPEGGWDDPELDLAAKLGVQVVTLGGRIVRAETASIAITAILLHRFGDIN
jgi:16S rRNA (uracil1498-N3)-methyltransferase